jgi:hypothetical protein
VEEGGRQVAVCAAVKITLPLLRQTSPRIDLSSTIRCLPSAMDEDVRLANGMNSPHNNGKYHMHSSIVKEEEMGPESSREGSRPASKHSEEREVKQDSESTTTLENASGIKSSRKASRKTGSRTAPLFDHLPDATEDSLEHFQIIHDCLYGSRNIGSSDNDALDCDCAEEWRKSTATPLTSSRSAGASR